MEVVKVKSHKLVADKGTHYVVQHPDGEEFKIAKHSVDPLTLQKVANLQKVENYAEGGDVESPDDKYLNAAQSTSPITDALPGQSDNLDSSAYSGMAKALDPTVASENNSAEEIKSKFSDLVRNPPPTTNAAPSDAVFSPTPAPAGAAHAPMQSAENTLGGSEMYNQNAQQMLSAADEYGKAQNIASQRAAKVYADSVAAQEKMATEQQAHLDVLNNQSKQLIAEGAQGHIDPKGYFHNMSTGGKIMSAISMVLGGIGAGLTGGRNMGLDTINAAIDRDIDSQKANLNNKNTLLGRNLELTKDMTQAMNMTRSQLASITAGQIAGIEAQNLGPQAKMNAAKLKNEVLMQVGNHNMQMAKLASQQRLASGAGTPQDLMYNPESADKAVTLPNGQVAMAKSAKAAEELNKKAALTKSVSDQIKRLDEIGKSGAMSPQKRDEANSIITGIGMTLAKEQGYQRYSKELMEALKQRISNPTSIKEGLGLESGKKSGILTQGLEDDLNRDLESNLINYKAPKRPQEAPKR